MILRSNDIEWSRNNAFSEKSTDYESLNNDLTNEHWIAIYGESDVDFAFSQFSVKLKFHIQNNTRIQKIERKIMKREKNGWQL